MPHKNELIPEKPVMFIPPRKRQSSKKTNGTQNYVDQVSFLSPKIKGMYFEIANSTDTPKIIALFARTGGGLVEDFTNSKEQTATAKITQRTFDEKENSQQRQYL